MTTPRPDWLALTTEKAIDPDLQYVIRITTSGTDLGTDTS
tara:strand:- start:990 stop:1109 length:120 start_codon:yes stop_codon:yes gene_type:complete